jgi:hypothetical protein
MYCATFSVRVSFELPCGSWLHDDCHEFHPRFERDATCAAPGEDSERDRQGRESQIGAICR